MHKIKLATVGVCIIRDPFNSRYETNYKEWYEVVNTTFQTSMISLMTDKVQLSDEDLKDTCSKEQHKQNLIEEISKGYLDILIKSQPEYILLDLYSEIRYGVIKHKDTYITNAQAKIRQTDFYKKGKYDEIIMYHKDRKRYLELLDLYFEKFISVINEKLPNTKIILVKGRYAHSYIDNDNIIRYMDLNKFSYIDRENKDWEEINNYMINKYNLDFIDMTNREYYADPNYPFGFSPWHYEKKYYQDFIKELNSICLKHLLIERQ